VTKLSLPHFKQLIITRPVDQAESLLKQLALSVDHSITICQLPLIQILPLDFSLARVTDVDGVIFISGNAARYFYADQRLPAKGLLVKPLSDTPLLAVGNNTSAKVEQLSGQRVAFPQQMDAEGLLSLPQLKSIAGQHWLIVKGKGGRVTIRQTLIDRGAKVSEVDVYQRKLPDFDTQQQIYRTESAQTVWIITSAQALTNLHRILGLIDNPRHTTQVIISSNRLAQLEKQKRFTIIAQSAGAC